MYVVSFLIISIFLVSCEGRTVKENTAKIRFINASYNTGDINVWIDYKKVFTTDIQPLNYSLFSEHINTTHYMQIKNAGGTLIRDTALSMVQGARYTGILYDSMNQVHFKLIEEDFSTPQGSYCKMRFLHLSNNAPATDIRAGSDSTVLFSNYSNGDISEYQVMNIDSKRFNAADHGNLTPYYTQGNDVQFKAGAFYTMYLKGNIGSSSNDSIGFFVIENNGDY